MKKLTFILPLAATALLVTLAPSFAGIAGTDHDLGGEICKPCHTPHNANTSVTDAPLWNHAITTQTFTPYSSATLTATVGQPDGISKLCLSCHDGVTLVNGGSAMTGTAALGVDLTSSHPVSFTYDTALATADGGLHDPSAALSGLGGTINADLLRGGKLECASCHDVHDNSVSPFLVKSNAGSALCLTCHDK